MGWEILLMFIIACLVSFLFGISAIYFTIGDFLADNVGETLYHKVNGKYITIEVKSVEVDNDEI